MGLSTEIKPVRGKAENAAHIKGTSTWDMVQQRKTFENLKEALGRAVAETSGEKQTHTFWRTNTSNISIC